MLICNCLTQVNDILALFVVLKNISFNETDCLISFYFVNLQK